MIKKWNTMKLALYGLFFGAIYSPFREGNIQNMSIVELVSIIIGGSIGGAILFVSVSGIRNLLLQAKR